MSDITRLLDRRAPVALALLLAGLVSTGCIDQHNPSMGEGEADAGADADVDDGEDPPATAFEGAQACTPDEEIDQSITIEVEGGRETFLIAAEAEGCDTYAIRPAGADHDLPLVPGYTPACHQDLAGPQGQVTMAVRVELGEAFTMGLAAEFIEPCEVPLEDRCEGGGYMTPSGSARRLPPGDYTVTLLVSTDVSVCLPDDRRIVRCVDQPWHPVWDYQTLCSGWDRLEVPITVGETGDVFQRVVRP